MRKYLVSLVALCALAIPAAAFAHAVWDNTKNGDLVAAGAACEDGDAGAWYHFVNNQTDGATGGTLTTSFINPTASPSTGPLAVNRNVMHFYVWAEGTLQSAQVDSNEGKLVISGIACGKSTDSPRDLFD